MRASPIALVSWLVAVVLAVLPAPTAAHDAAQLLKTSGVRGGLVVHLGCGDGRLTAGLRAGDAYLVHGLAADAAKVARARAHLESLGIYGPVSIDTFDGRRLPYADNLVNLVVVSDQGEVPMHEVMRVLAPRGVVLVLKDGQWQKTVKPWPDEIDEWTHYLRGADNNAVADDTRVAPPEHMQWVAGPVWSRSHDHLASLGAAVSAGGRLFCIVDEGPIASAAAPSAWRLVARDAFSGVLLWKRKIAPWEDRLRPFRSGPTELPRRLVAIGDRVYVTLGYGKPLACLDAATGETLKTYEGTDNTHEVLYSEGKLYLTVSQAPAEDSGTSAELVRRLPPWTGRPVYRQYVVRYLPKSLVVLDAESGTEVWRKMDAETEHLLPSSLTVAERRVFFQNGKHLVALDATSGKVLWRAERPVSLHRPGFSSPTVVAADGVVLSADRSAKARTDTGGKDASRPEWLVSPTMISAKGEIMAFSAPSGEKLWTAPCSEAFNSPVDLFVIDGKVYSGYTVSKGQPGIAKAYDLHTGEVVATRPHDKECFTVGFVHGRCYRNKATTNFVIHGRAGLEFVDLDTKDVQADHWIRGTCQYGILACNGLVYVPPHSCACYNEAKLNSLNALAPARGKRGASTTRATGTRGQATHGATGSLSARALGRTALQQGPAHGEVDLTEATTESAWPTYRHDPARSGASASPVSLPLARAWTRSLSGPLTAVTVADGRLYVAEKDAHTLRALDAANGRPLWQSTTGARIDSPPTIHGGGVYFGSADGWIYCLRAEDGRLAWRYRAAADATQVVAHNQLESAWPVHGSVMVQPASESGTATVYAVAGRSSFLDGGMFLVGLDAATGKPRVRERICHRDPKTGREPQATIAGKRGTYMPGALPDILSSDGESVFMRHARFNLQGKPLAPQVDHLFSPAGFLDDAWWHRTYWLAGTEMLPDYHGWPVMGCERIAGRLLVTAGDRVYGFGRKSYEKAGSHLGLNTQYHLYAADAELGPPKPPEKDPGDWWRSFPGSRVKRFWSQELPFLVRAMATGGETLFVAGPAEVTNFKAPQPNGKVPLWAVSTRDGAKLGEWELPAAPVFDSMAVAEGRLYLTTVGGDVMCFGAREPR